MTEEVQQPVTVYSLFANTVDTKTLTIECQGTEFEFRYRDLTWAEKSEIIDSAYTMEADGSMHMSIGKYKLACIVQMVVDSPIHQAPDLLWNETVVGTLNPYIVDQLASIVPVMDTTLEMEEVKKD